MGGPLRRIGARLVPHLLMASALITLAVLVREWAWGTTYRLYLDRRIDASASSTATQRFDLEHGHVMPQIVMHDDRVMFRAAIGRDSVIRAEVRPQGLAQDQVLRRAPDGARTLCAGVVSRPGPLACQFPSGSGTLESVVRGDITWADLRIDRTLKLGLGLVVLALLAIAGGLWLWLAHLPWSDPAVWRVSPRAVRAWGGILTLIASTGVTSAAIEVALEAIGTRISPSISAARHDLGEPTADPRWQQSTRYGPRLAANFDGSNVWRDGDIIRMGFLSPALADGTIHRFAFQTDREGFRNAATRDPIDIAALGDSFTDALTLPIDAGWPMQLERRLGVAVQNYGTAGFGPQQELLVLSDYAVRHRPKVVVLAFFAGNDIRDAEVFELAGRTDAAVDHPQLGWPIKDIVSRADTWFLMSAFRAASTAVVRSAATELSAAPTAAARTPPTPFFDRGLFTVPFNGRVMRWAFMPPYLNLLNFSESDLEARRGWTLTRQSLTEMRRVSRTVGARFVVVFLPFKSQVYLPLLERTFSREQLANALRVSLHGLVASPDPDRMLRNRLALNALMRRFCEQSEIPFLDVTDALAARVDDGENVYFPDDSHLNEVGEAIVAEVLAEFLRRS